VWAEGTLAKGVTGTWSYPYRYCKTTYVNTEDFYEGTEASEEEESRSLSSPTL